MKKAKNRTLCFKSVLSPQDFIQLAHETVLEEYPSYTDFIRTERGFSFQIDAHHSGKEFFECEVCSNEQGGSIINGTITHQSWHYEQSVVEKIVDGAKLILLCVILFPVFIYIGINNFILRFSKKEKLSPYEKKAINFMTNKLGCTQKQKCA